MQILKVHTIFLMVSYETDNDPFRGRPYFQQLHAEDTYLTCPHLNNAITTCHIEVSVIDIFCICAMCVLYICDASSKSHKCAQPRSICTQVSEAISSAII